MKATIVFAALLSVVLSKPALEAYPEKDAGLNMKYFLVERSKGVYEIEDLVNSEIDAAVSASDLTYHFFSRDTSTTSVVVTPDTVSTLRNSNFDVTKETVFIVHGWNNHQGSAVNTHIRSALLPKHDVNVFVVDWSPVAAKNYISAKNSVLDVGKYVATFVRSLVSTYGLQLSRLTFVGHSLGAHVAGNAGAALNGEVSVIVGLDPAGPLFSSSNTDNRLDTTDGRFVEIIHTNGGLLGMSAAIGHSDYYPNGGGSQPGCGIDLTGSCAHSRSYQYYAESISAPSNRFISTACSGYSDFTKGRCTANAKSAVGGYGVDTSARGSYYLDTNRESPYALG